MRAGDLDRTIRIERATTTPNELGVPHAAWALVATMRAQVLQFATDDREGERGHTTDQTITFRTRWIDGVDLSNRVVYQDQPFTIRQIKEIGRRVGLDIVCERVGP
ncbi:MULTISPECIES: phage head closure protein [Rhodopseudomonas]|uniref:Head-tail adaptor protein n=1 Tax=Rhodopseudomonas palustris TaxID=1076 RepID=A0A0D7EUI1_RHOPL|nr:MULTISPECIES: phage head closure protein [Rhodopseudomonas]KIZ43102.1 hypothetical protein OO17_11900 [Rhodopseudomonas palustris]MDF3810687.1 phage head closure protein [Rhodopseudomonas sp. BAL398]WOK18478.1 phage head closure protein [Rhodopseudomonas sp. BAL398]